MTDHATESAPASSQRPSLLGQVIAERYQIEEKLGEGGMGAVYRATHLQLNKPVAIKVLHPEMTAMEEAVKRFEREAIVSARIEHPNVVNATDSGKLPDGSFYLALAYVSGKSLSSVIKTEGTLEEARALNITTQIAQALAAAHAEGVVHRDLKPDNVMLVERQEDADFVKVLDFGIAKLESSSGDSTQALTKLGSVFGTPQYMSPEQATGSTVDARSDLYTVGLMLYEMLAGKTPFESDDLMVMLTRQVTQDPPPLPKGVSKDVSRVVMRLLKKDPAERQQSAQDLIAELEALQSPKSAVQARTLMAPISTSWIDNLRQNTSDKLSRPVKVGGRSMPLWSVAFAGACVLALLGVIVWAATGSDSPTGGTSASKEKKAPPPSITPALMSQARAGDVEAMEKLKSLARRHKHGPAWLAVGHGRALSSNIVEALAAYDWAIQADSDLAKNEELVTDVRQFAEDERYYKLAQQFARDKMGSLGIDLLEDVWRSAKTKTKQSTLAESYVTKSPGRNRASEALSVALDLADAKGCKAYKELLPRVKQYGDERCVSKLSKLRHDRGCGFLGLQDCYPCLRRNRDLSEAIEQAKGRDAPSF